ncbi:MULTISPECIES: hypothetical protein [unclassified Mesorhizobium]|uniref:hypothetical protein n=1 Tax=unclassified Mesorhizobium TaxID=325217 RepID=UPI001CD04BB3|nr:MULTISPECIES: hypothetical protein [unclassified Mesorhizobium]MCA0031899.1 hypothetical protein [Mesorhizobium sp. B263B2A]
MDVFDSAIRRKGDFAGIFEYDETDGAQNARAYFYLSEIKGQAVGPIIGTIIFAQARGRSPRQMSPLGGIVTSNV